MKKFILIVVKNGTKYQLGIDKTVQEVLKDICDSEQWYCPVETCAIQTKEIVSVEQFEYDPNESQEGEQ